MSKHIRQKALKYIAIGTMIAAALAMAVATAIEHLYGTQMAHRTVYHAPWFIGLWAVGIGAGIGLMLAKGQHRRPAVLLLHAAAALILSGALLTYRMGYSGMMHLRLDAQQPTNICEVPDSGPIVLPFALRLLGFSVVRYPGSQAAMDYTAQLLVLQPNKQADTAIVAMNRIAKHQGHRIYMGSYDDDELGVSLAVSYDPVGTGITYTGYALLLVGLGALLFGPKGRFWKARGRLASLVVVFVGFAAAPPRAEAAPQPSPPSLPPHVASELGRLLVYHNQRVAPLQSLARDYTMALYGSPSVHGLSPEQVLSGLVFYPNAWEQLPLRHKPNAPRYRELHQLRRQALSAEPMRIFPYTDSTGTVRWYGPADRLPQQMPTEQWMFFKKALSLMGESVYKADWPEVLRLIDKIALYQQKEAAPVLPSASQIGAERLYNRLGHPKAMAIGSTALGLLLFALMAIALSRQRQLPLILLRSAAAALLLVGLYLLLVLVLRWWASGHVPMSNGFEVMLLMACMGALIVAAAHRRIPTLLPLGFVLSGLAMLVATLGESNPPIGHLMPVLRSPLLSAHVACMMLSYTLFGLAALNGLMGLCTPPPEAKLKLANLSLTALFPALFLLVAGTCIGAVWANISWGRYWSWDPKETWALISIMAYTPVLHINPSGPARPQAFHAFCLAAFAAILITYFGVNLLLGGMHSYA